MTHPFRQIILHAGLPKTGSTSIQNNFFHHRELLAECGLEYPEFELGERQLVNHSDPLTAILFDKRNLNHWAFRMGVMERQDETREEFRRQFNRIVEDSASDTLVLSAEAVTSFDRKQLRALRKKLLKLTDRLRVIALVRSPLETIDSMLQQQAYGGGTEDNIADIVGAVAGRLDRLERAFGSELEILEFHLAKQEPGGIVGALLCHLGVPADRVAQLEFSRSNERVSMEAYKLMVAINRRHPIGPVEEGGCRRRFHDLKPLARLPGNPFRIDSFRDTQWYAAALEETAELERRYGFAFPAHEAHQPASLWGMDTLLALEDALSLLAAPQLRLAAGEQLAVEARALESSEPRRAAILDFIAQRARAAGDLTPQSILDELGADYFKFAALQVGQDSPRLAHRLMALARYLRPGAPFIEQRLAQYRDKLGES
jgi:hypothetical protein